MKKVLLLTSLFTFALFATETNHYSYQNQQRAYDQAKGNGEMKQHRYRKEDASGNGQQHQYRYGQNGSNGGMHRGGKH